MADFVTAISCGCGHHETDHVARSGRTRCEHCLCDVYRLTLRCEVVGGPLDGTLWRISYSASAGAWVACRYSDQTVELATQDVTSCRDAVYALADRLEAEWPAR